MNLSAGLIRKLEALDPKMRDVFLCFMEEVDEKTKIIAVGRSDFDELKDVVRQLAEAQNRTEHQLKELAEAQNRTEHKLEELADAQKLTEHRVEELTEAQRELTEAQKKTEISVRALAVGLNDLRSQVGGLSMAVGYGIEDRLIPHLRRFALQEYGIKVTLVDRRNVFYPDGKYDEVNLYVEGKKDGHTLYLIGECKAQPGKKDFDRFSKMLERLQNVLKGEITPLVVGYQFAPDVEAYAAKRYPRILRYKTFQITAHEDIA
jgi:vacuolar-type H+-ATPase subunit I/STV1